MIPEHAEITEERFRDFRGYVIGREIAWIALVLIFLAMKSILALLFLLVGFPGFAELRLAHGSFERFRRDYPRLLEKRRAYAARHDVGRWSVFTKLVIIVFCLLLIVLCVVVAMAGLWFFLAFALIPAAICAFVIWRWVNADTPSVLNLSPAEIGEAMGKRDQKPKNL